MRYRFFFMILAAILSRDEKLADASLAGDAPAFLRFLRLPPMSGAGGCGVAVAKLLAALKRPPLGLSDARVAACMRRWRLP